MISLDSVKRFIKQVPEKYPFANKVLWAGQKVYAFYAFGGVRKFLEGSLLPRSDSNSVVLLTTHKCASTYTTELVRKLVATKDICHLDLSNFIWFNGLSVSEFYQSTTGKEIFKPKGFFFGPFRSYEWDIPLDQALKIILILRDPRDVITSNFYSYAFSHLVLVNSWTKDLIDDRRNIRESGIDRYVKMRTPFLLKTYSHYVNYFLGKPNVFFCKYEDMIDDFPSWIKQLSDFLEIDPSSPVINQLINTSKGSNKSSDKQVENIYSKKRQLKPGNYKQKLSPATIDRLNSDFSDILEILNYDP